MWLRDLWMGDDGEYAFGLLGTGVDKVVWRSKMNNAVKAYERLKDRR